MADIVKIIDVTRSFLPIDPNEMAPNLVATQREDQPEQPMPIIAFEGENFLPTTYGYESYFGTDTKLNIAALSGTIFQIILVSFMVNGVVTPTLIAATSSGTYINTGTVAGGAWSWLGMNLTGQNLLDGRFIIYKSYVLVNYVYFSASQYYHYTQYLYYSTPSSSWVLTPITFTYATPCTPTAEGSGFTNTCWYQAVTDLNNVTIPNIMFRAGARLGFTRESTVYWSDLAGTDFRPSLTTLAGFATFDGVTGPITAVRSLHDGFIIYTSSSIVGIRYNRSSTTMIWDSSVISDSYGVRGMNQVCASNQEAEHFAFTQAGIMKIGHYQDLSNAHKIVPIFPEIADYLLKSKATVTLKMINSRYLFLCLEDLATLTGYTSTLSTDNITTTPVSYSTTTTLLQTAIMQDYTQGYKGAFVLDTLLNRWGKFVGDFVGLVDLYGQLHNTTSNIPTQRDGIEAAIINAAGEIRPFTRNPTNSWMRWGKIGFYRQGFTQGLEVRANFRTPSKGTIIVDTSLDGRTLDPSLQQEFPFEPSLSVEGKFSSSGRYHTVKVSGQFDIQFLEFRGNISGKR